MSTVTRLVFARKMRVRPIGSWVRRYCYPPAGQYRWPMRWWAYLREWLWLNWSDQYHEKIEYIEVGPKVEPHIIAAIGNSRHNLQRVFYGDLKHAIVGPAQMGLLRAYGRACSFPVTADVQHGGLIKACGLTVHLIPWFDGCLLLPDLPEKKGT